MWLLGVCPNGLAQPGVPSSCSRSTLARLGGAFFLLTLFCATLKSSLTAGALRKGGTWSTGERPFFPQGVGRVLRPMILSARAVTAIMGLRRSLPPWIPSASSGARRRIGGPVIHPAVSARTARCVYAVLRGSCVPVECAVFEPACVRSIWRVWWCADACIAAESLGFLPPE